MQAKAKTRELAWLVVTGISIAFATSCALSETDATCSAVCSRYGDCFDEELDVDSCTGDCVDSSDANNAFVSDIDRCEKCMDMEGCRESAFDCFDECGRVTGQSALP